MLNKIRKEINYFPKRPFVRDVFTLQIGTFFSLILSLVASIVFARVLGAERYGVYVLIFVFTSLVSIFTNIGSAYTLLTLLPEAYVRKDKQEVCNILTYFLKINFFFTFFVNLVVIIFAPQLAEILYHQSNIGVFARWILFATIFQTFFIFFTAILQAIRKIKALTILENIDKLSYNLFPIIFVLIGGGLLWLVGGKFLSSLLMFLVAVAGYNYLTKKDKILPTFEEIFKNIFKVKINKYFKLGFQIEIDNNIGALLSLLPVIFLGVMAVNEQVSFFRIAVSYVSLSLILLKPISRLLMVQLPKSKTYGFRVLRKDFWKSSLLSGVMAIVIILPFVIFAPFLIKLFYGPEFLPTIPLIYHLMIYPVILGFSVGIAPIIRTINKVSMSIIFNIFIFLIGLPLVYFLIKFYGPKGAVWGLNLWYFLSLVIYFVYLEYYFKHKQEEFSLTNINQ